MVPERDERESAAEVCDVTRAKAIVLMVIKSLTSHTSDGDSKKWNRKSRLGLLTIKIIKGNESNMINK